MFRCSILAVFVLLLPLSAQTTDEPARHSPSATQKKDRSRCPTSAADDLMTRPVPHPYLYVAFSRMPAGYVIGAIRAEGGLNVEACHLLASAGAAYDNGRAANDNGLPNPKGHDRYLDGTIDHRPGWLFSGGGFFGVSQRAHRFLTSDASFGTVYRF